MADKEPDSLWCAAVLNVPGLVGRYSVVFVTDPSIDIRGPKLFEGSALILSTREPGRFSVGKKYRVSVSEEQDKPRERRPNGERFYAESGGS